MIHVSAIIISLASHLLSANAIIRQAYTVFRKNWCAFCWAKKTTDRGSSSTCILLAAGILGHGLVGRVNQKGEERIKVL